MGLLALLDALHSPPSPQPPGPSQTVLAAYGLAPLALHTALLTLLFAALSQLLAPRLLALLPAQHPKPLSPKARRMMAGYAVAVLHHLWVGPLSVHALAQLAAGAPFPYRLMLTVPPVTLAYLLCDLAFYALPLWDVEFLLHHAITIAMTLGFLASPLTVLRWVASLTMCELSSVPFAACYFCLKVAQWNGSLAHALAEAAFFSLFFMARVINLPAAVYALLARHPGEAAALGAASTACLVALCAMQFYWAFKILQKLAAKFAPQQLRAPAPADAKEE
jgi:hypothetical protein